MSISAKKRFEILKRDNFTCGYCSRTSPEVVLEVDHVVPKAVGGTDDSDNLTTACRDCNRGKGRISINQAQGSLELLESKYRTLLHTWDTCTGGFGLSRRDRMFLINLAKKFTDHMVVKQMDRILIDGKTSALTLLERRVNHMEQQGSDG